MGSGRYEIRVGHWIRVVSGCDKPRNVRHVDHKESAAGICVVTEALEIDGSRIRAGAGNDQLRLGLHRLFIKLIVINLMCDRPRHKRRNDNKRRKY